MERDLKQLGQSNASSNCLDTSFRTENAVPSVAKDIAEGTAPGHDHAVHARDLRGHGRRAGRGIPARAAGLVPAPRGDLPILPFGRGETVLVLDDAGGRLLADEEMLAALGYEPVGFTRAGDALAACRATPKRFDVLVVGHLVPAASALDLAAELHRIVPDVPILLATASADEMVVDELLSASVSEVVHLPLISAEIASALARCLGRATDVTHFPITEITL